MNIQYNYGYSNYAKPAFKAITGFDAGKIRAGIKEYVWAEGIVSSEPELEKLGEKVNINFSLWRPYPLESAYIKYTISEIGGKRQEEHTFFADMMAIRNIWSENDAREHFLKCIKLNVDKFLGIAKK